MKQSLLAAITLASAIMLFWRGRPVPAVHAAASVRSHPAAYFVCLGHRAMLEGPDSREPGDDEHRPRLDAAYQVENIGRAQDPAGMTFEIRRGLRLL